MFSQEEEILVLAVHGGDKDSITVGGICVVPKGKSLCKKGGKEQTATAWGTCFAQRKKKIHSITAAINYTEKTVRKRHEETSGGSKVCRRKMHPPRVEWQRSEFRFETLGF